METDNPQEDQEAISLPDHDWEQRILCSDGNCIGVIGPDGCCKECGKKYEGPRPIENASAPDRSDGDEADRLLEPSGILEKSDVIDTIDIPPADGEWEDRVLCSDGNCIGVIGPDGRCKECGKAYEG